MDRIKNWFRQFMDGRYGMDKLNSALLWSSVAVVFLGFLLPPLLRLILTALAYGLMIWAIVRFLSRQSYKRYCENRRFLLLLDRIRDREHRYYTCPRCRQPVRVPRGKGKIAITCPRCKEKFVKKT